MCRQTVPRDFQEAIGPAVMAIAEDLGGGGEAVAVAATGANKSSSNSSSGGIRSGCPVFDKKTQPLWPRHDSWQEFLPT